VDTDNNAITLNITINNAYPGYNPVITLNITNTDAIPVKLYNSSVIADDSLQVNLITPDINPDALR